MARDPPSSGDGARALSGKADGRHMRAGNINVYEQLLRRDLSKQSKSLHIVLSLAHDANRFKESLRHDSKVGLEQQWRRQSRYS